MPTVIKENKPKKSERSPVIQRALLVATTGCAILSIVPPLRFAGALALRGVALLSATHSCATSTSQANLDKLSKYGKVAVVALGLVALAASLPALFIASLAADIAIQVVEIGKAIHSGESGKAVYHLGMLAIDTLALSGLVCGSWQLMVAAASVGAAMMLSHTVVSVSRTALRTDIKEGSNEEIWYMIEQFCNLALVGTMIATAFTTAEYLTSKSVASFKGRNDTDQPMNFYDKNGQWLHSIQPGESYDFKVDFTALSLVPGTRATRYIPVTSSDGSGLLKLLPDYVERVNAISKSPLDSVYFPTLPLGGTAIHNERLEKSLEEGLSEIQYTG